MKKIVIALIVLFLVGCNQSELDQSIELDEVVNVTSPIDYYELTMSSVPGFPIKINVSEAYSDTTHKVQFITDKGNLLTWENSDVKIYGKQLRVNLSDTTVYWSPNDCEETYEGCTVSVEVIDESNNVVASEKFHIVSEDRRYTFENN